MLGFFVYEIRRNDNKTYNVIRPTTKILHDNVSAERDAVVAADIVSLKQFVIILLIMHERTLAMHTYIDCEHKSILLKYDN